MHSYVLLCKSNVIHVRLTVSASCLFENRQKRNCVKSSLFPLSNKESNMFYTTPFYRLIQEQMYHILSMT